MEHCARGTHEQNQDSVIPMLRRELDKHETQPYSATQIGDMSCRGYSQKTYGDLEYKFKVNRERK